MSGCLAAQHALRRLAAVEAAISRLNRKVDLMAEMLGVDAECLRCAELLDEMDRSGGQPWSFDQIECLERRR